MNIIEVLNLICEEIESINPLEDKFLRSKGNDNGFEDLFPIIAEKVAKKLSPTDILTFKVHLGHHFPDVDLILNDIKYGVELKSRNNGTWSTNGNSVFESITGDGYEDIFLMFGSKVPNEKRLLVRVAPYWKATSNIKVTHSPRFTIDMENLHESVFESKEEYDSLRAMDEQKKVQFLQDYLRKNSIGAKWYTTPAENISPTKFKTLSAEKKNQLRVELFILFPDDLLIGPQQTKYERSGEYLLETYFIYNSSLRDVFSSGGVYTFNDIEFPKMIKTLKSLQKPLKETLNTASLDFFDLAKESWGENLPPDLISDNLYDSYTNVLNYLGEQEPYASLLEQTNVPTLSDMIF